MNREDAIATCEACGHTKPLRDTATVLGNVICADCLPIGANVKDPDLAEKITTAFLFSGIDPQGDKIVSRVAALTVPAAKQLLERAGYSEITFHGDEMSAATAKLFGTKQIVDNRVAGTPEQDLALQEEGLFPPMARAIASALLASWTARIGILAIVVVSAWQIYIGHYLLPSLFALGLMGLASIPILLARKMSVGGNDYDDLMRAVEWGLWDDVEQLVKKARQRGTMIPEAELAKREAQVLASRGQLAQGLRLLETLGPDANVEPWMLLMSKAAVYATAHDYDSAIRISEEALAVGPKSAGEYISLAYYLIHRKRDAGKAREYLDAGISQPLMPFAESHVSFVQGMIALEEGQIQKALDTLEQALNQAGRFEGQLLIGGHIREIKAYKVLALAQLGQQEKAKSLWAEIEPFFESIKDADILQRCRTTVNK
jgi:tetratricopeptide (TPR) repeat protein